MSQIGRRSARKQPPPTPAPTPTVASPPRLRDGRLVEFGERLARERKAAGLTQAELTQGVLNRAVHIPATAIAKVEIGDRPTSALEVEAIAATLNIPVSRLIPGTSRPWQNWENLELAREAFGLARTRLLAAMDTVESTLGFTPDDETLTARLAAERRHKPAIPADAEPVDQFDVEGKYDKAASALVTSWRTARLTLDSTSYKPLD